MELPDEIWLKIFGYLTISDNLKQISLVSKRFNNLSKDSCLIKKAHLFDITDLKVEHIANMLIRSKWKWLKELYVTCKEITEKNEFDNYSALIKMSLQRCKTLRILKINIGNINSDMDEVCKNIHDFGQNIEHLEILRTWPGTKSYHKGTNFLCQMKNLKYLRLKRITLSLANIFALAENSPNMIAIEFCFDDSHYGVMKTVRWVSMGNYNNRLRGNR